MSGNTYDEEIAPPADAVKYDEEIAPPPGMQMTSTGIAAPQGVGPSVTGPDSVLGGVMRRGAATAKGIYSLVKPPENSTETAIGLASPGALPMYRMGQGLYQAEQQAAPQLKNEFGQAVSNAQAGDYYGAALRGGQALTTGLSMLNPLATGSVANINQLTDEGRYREALGQGGFDALTMMLGKKVGSEPSITTKLNRLAYATDAKGLGSVRPITKIYDDLAETARTSGKSQTVGQLQQVVTDTGQRLENKFNIAVQGMGAKLQTGQPIQFPVKISTQEIANALKQKADSLPRSGAAEATELRNEAKLYDGQTTTARELNADRILRNGRLNSFYKQAGTRQAASMQANASTMVDEIVADKARDVLYDELDKRYPGQNFRDLKLKQSAMKDMIDHFRDHVNRLEATQAASQGEPAFTKSSASASVHPGGNIVTPRFHLRDFIPGRSPMGAANTAVQGSFGPTAAASMRRAAILSLPVGALTGQRPPVIPPPPEVQGPQ